jgi:hypothetical protein
VGDPGSKDETRSLPGLGWWGIGAGNVAVRSEPPKKPTVWLRIGRLLGSLVLFLVIVGLPLLGIAMMGDPAYTPEPETEVLAAVPQDLGGRWEGSVQYLSRSQSVLPPQQQARSTWTIRIELDPGRPTGRLSVVERGCSQELSGFSGTKVRLSFPTAKDGGGDECLPPGTLDLNVDPDGAQRLDFDWQINFPPGARAQGSLSRPATP